MFTDEELDKLMTVAHEHDSMAGYDIDDSILATVLLRMVDFECNTKFAEYHKIDDDLAKRIDEYLMVHAADAPTENIGMLGLMVGAYNKYMPEEVED